MRYGLRRKKRKRQKSIDLFLLHRLPPETHNTADHEVRISHRDAPPAPGRAESRRCPCQPPAAGTGSPTQRLESKINTTPRPPPGERRAEPTPTPKPSLPPRERRRQDVRLQPKSDLPGSKSGMRAWYSAPTLIPTSATQRGERN